MGSEGLPAEISEVSPTSLTCGFGVNVCNVLTCLADAALLVVGFAPKALVYGESTVIGNNDGDADGINKDGDKQEEEEDDVSIPKLFFAFLI